MLQKFTVIQPVAKSNQLQKNLMLPLTARDRVNLLTRVHRRICADKTSFRTSTVVTNPINDLTPLVSGAEWAVSNHGRRKRGKGGFSSQDFEIRYLPVNPSVEKIFFFKFEVGKMKFHHCAPLEWNFITVPPWEKSLPRPWTYLLSDLRRVVFSFNAAAVATSELSKRISCSSRELFQSRLHGGGFGGLRLREHSLKPPQLKYETL